MTSRKAFIAYAAALGCLGSLAAVAPAQAESMNFVERASSDAITDLGAKGDSPGDILTFANELYDEANQTKVGDDNGWCVRTVAGKAWECFWTTTLADGQITVEGPFLDAGDSTLAITGGTGKYSEAQGEMRLHSRNKEGTEYDFKFDLEE